MTAAELEAQILANADDPAAYLVYGDWLQGQGDPRGELVATQGARLAHDTAELAASEAGLLAAHSEALGLQVELDPAPQIEWYLGFWRTLGIGRVGWAPEPALLERVGALLACDSARFLRELAVWGGVTPAVIPLVASTHRTLRSLELSLGPSAFDDAALAGLRDCTELRKLQLFSCDRVTAAGLEALCAMRDLADLDLRNHELTDDGAAWLAGLPLHDVKFSACRLTARGMRQLAALPLARLELRGGVVDDAAVATLASHQTLAHLELGDAMIGARGAAALGSLTALRRLHIRGSSIDDPGVRSLAGLAGLAALHLGHCEAVADAGCAALGGLTALRFLDVSATAVTGAGLRSLAHLRGLETLDLSFLDLGDADARALLAFPRLTGVGLAYSGRLTDATIDILCQLEHLTTLDLGGTSITEAGIARLAQMPNLRELGVTSCADAVRAHAETFPHWYVNHQDCLDFEDGLY